MNFSVEARSASPWPVLRDLNSISERQRDIGYNKRLVIKAAGKLGDREY